eukprot:364912-Chlamydomonas_euryale.AAC.24
MKGCVLRPNNGLPWLGKSCCLYQANEGLASEGVEPLSTVCCAQVSWAVAWAGPVRIRPLGLGMGLHKSVRWGRCCANPSREVV